jgi:hypothetical protein
LEDTLEDTIVFWKVRREFQRHEKEKRERKNSTAAQLDLLREHVPHRWKEDDSQLTIPP